MAEVVTGKLSEVRDAEVIIERPDGSRITVVVNIRPHKNQRGEVIGAINCFYDITHRKLNEEALRLSDSNKTQFLAMLAHELRNPLAPILVSIEILRRAQQLDEIPTERADGPDTAPFAARADVHHRVDHALKVLTRQVAHMARLVEICWMRLASAAARSSFAGSAWTCPRWSSMLWTPPARSVSTYNTS